MAGVVLAKRENEMIIIHHANESILPHSFAYGFGCPMERLIVEWNNGQYNQAGVIDTDDLDVAYCESQNLAKAWGDGNQRSTSVGDILETDDGVYLVAREGFDKIKIKVAA
jgi:hypothetical protein